MSNTGSKIVKKTKTNKTSSVSKKKNDEYVTPTNNVNLDNISFIQMQQDTINNLIKIITKSKKKNRNKKNKNDIKELYEEVNSHSEAIQNLIDNQQKTDIKNKSKKKKEPDNLNHDKVKFSDFISSDDRNNQEDPLIQNMMNNMLSSLFGGESKKKKKEDFAEIKNPDMSYDIMKNINVDNDDNKFIELEFKNIDDIYTHGCRFISEMESFNIEKNLVDDKNTSNEKNSIDEMEDTNENSYHNDPINIFKNIFNNFDHKDVTIDIIPLSFDGKILSPSPLKFGQLNDTNSKYSFLKTPSNASRSENKKMSINDKLEPDENGFYNFLGKKYSISPFKLMKLVKPIQYLNTMVGMKDIKNSIFKFVTNFIQNTQNTGMLNTAIYGKPGVGKTDLGKILCMIYSALEIIPSEKFKLVKASELIGQYVGQTRQKTKQVLDEANGGVLFIDEAYSLSSGSSERGSFGKECIDTINQELSENRKNLIVIIAGYESDIQHGFFNINQGLDRRFPFRYTLKKYSQEEMKDIFMRMLRIEKKMYLYKDNVKENLTVTDNDIIELFNDERYFENCGGDIENLITHIKFANSVRTIGKHPKMRNIITKDDLKNGLIQFKSTKKIEDKPSHYMFYN